MPREYPDVPREYDGSIRFDLWAPYWIAQGSVIVSRSRSHDCPFANYDVYSAVTDGQLEGLNGSCSLVANTFPEAFAEQVFLAIERSRLSRPLQDFAASLFEEHTSGTKENDHA
jgi:hypothetical protein